MPGGTLMTYDARLPPYGSRLLTLNTQVSIWITKFEVNLKVRVTPSKFQYGPSQRLLSFLMVHWTVYNGIGSASIWSQGLAQPAPLSHTSVVLPYVYTCTSNSTIGTDSIGNIAHWVKKVVQNTFTKYQTSSVWVRLIKVMRPSHYTIWAYVSSHQEILWCFAHMCLGLNVQKWSVMTFPAYIEFFAYVSSCQCK